MFHEHVTIEDMEKILGGAKFTYEGVANLTLGQTSLESATDEIKMIESWQGTEIEESTIGDKENVNDNNIGGADQGE